MKEKELRKLSREELLELLLVQTRETERLGKRLEKAEAELAERKINIERSGSLAEASMRINGVFKAAESAAKQYLENIISLENETREKCKKILEDAEYEAERIRKGKPKDTVTEVILGEINDFINEKDGMVE
ncbi:MAG: hypothetical protein IJE28_02645 [Oscillospiraceae bacterium]|nr:hypothetical protein [Oscillospiraceae bacterium]MBQ3500774.1 hypothetical protein [Oscillospiraceae bacterium]MBQ4547415.1 hypothetical protein [Oscillospiraceae bacterium]MBQ4643593.1 hypothetical protein [Oscillospiraceae bacterium]